METESDRTAQVEAAKGDESSQTGGMETDRSSSGTEGVSSTGGAGAGKIQKNNAEAAITDAAWFTGFADTDDRRIYFCVYLGETDSENVSSARAREIAIEIVSDYLG